MRVLAYLTTRQAAYLLTLAGVLALGFAVRWQGIAWDGFAALHPDERHLFIVTQELFAALTDPANAGLSLSDWWFVPDSPLNPHRGDSSYVYGEAPLFLAAFTGWMLGATDWFAFIPVARALSVGVDTATILAVFLGARLLTGPAAALCAAALYAAMPTALQLANFHTVDVWLTVAGAFAMVPLIALANARWQVIGPFWLAALAGVAIGLAMSSKVTGIVMLIPLGLAVAVAVHRGLSRGRAAGCVAVALLAAFAVFRLTNPFAFAGPGVTGLAVSDEWISDFRGLSAVTAFDGFPPNWQWIAGYGLLRLARDFALFGVGPVAVALLALARPRLARPRLAVGGWIVPLSMALIFIVLMALSSVSALRYAAPALPAIAILATVAAARIGVGGLVIALIPALWWGAGAVRLHDGAHPRIIASHWLWEQPRGTVITNETAWDDHLPTIIAMDGAYRWPSHDDWFSYRVLDITAPDTPDKADRIAAILGETDLLVLSSDRQSAVMPRLPDRFPMTTAHYAALFSGLACFAPLHVQDRGYPLPLLGFDDSWAQEPWRVYDHPVVRIFRRQPCYREDVYAAFLRRSLAVDAVAGE